MSQSKSRIIPSGIEGGHVMITDNGTHPPHLYAQMAAQQLTPRSEGLSAEKRRAAINLQFDIEVILERHHQNLATAEAEALNDVADHADTEASVEDHEVADALSEIQAVAANTPWADHFTFGHGRPTWLDAHRADVAAMGADATPLTAAQALELENWEREKLIRRVIATHMGTHKHVERAHARQRRHQGAN